jgi:hypothetical protein
MGLGMPVAVHAMHVTNITIPINDMYLLVTTHKRLIFLIECTEALPNYYRRLKNIKLRAAEQTPSAANGVV